MLRAAQLLLPALLVALGIPDDARLAAALTPAGQAELGGGAAAPDHEVT